MIRAAAITFKHSFVDVDSMLLATHHRFYRHLTDSGTRRGIFPNASRSKLARIF